MYEKTYCPYWVNTNWPVVLSTRTNMKTTWHEIAEQIKSGNALELFSVGDEISETLITGEKVVFVVSGIDIYHKNEVIFTLKDCLEKAEQMNDTCSNEGGWTASKMRTKLNGEIFSTLPLDLQVVISPRMIDDNSNSLWLLSEREVFGDEGYVELDTDSDMQLPYYMRKGNRIKGIGNDGTAYYWWARSRNTNHTAGFCLAHCDGVACCADASSAFGVCFGFCI